MKEQIYFNISIEDAIRNWSKAKWKINAKSITVEGKHFTGESLRDAWIDLLASGTRHILIGYCDNYYQHNGCQGHDLPDDEQV